MITYFISFIKVYLLPKEIIFHYYLLKKSSSWLLSRNMTIVINSFLISSLTIYFLIGIHAYQSLRQSDNLPKCGQVMYLHSVMFELELVRLNDNDASSNSDNTPSTSSGLDRRGSQGARSILLKGQMRYIEDLKAIIFLCSPL